MPSRFLMITAAAALLAASPALAQQAARATTEFTLTTDAPRTVEQERVRFDEADLALKIMPETRTIEGVATLTFTTLAPVERLVVELDTVFDVSSVRAGDVEIAAGDWSNPEGRMTVELRSRVPTGEQVVLRIAYGGAPRVAPNAPWDGGFQWATAPTGEPWIATAVQPEGCDLFWPCIDSPLAEPRRVDLHVTIPSTLAAPSNGRLVDTVDHGDGWTTWNWTAREPNTYAVALNIGPYDTVTSEYRSRFGNSFPMTYWHLRGDRPEDVAGLYAQFAPMMDFYESTVGPYPFGDEKMGVVATPHLGMEHQTINAYGNQYRTDDGKGYDWLLHHELAHEWFGNQMTNANADDMWLHEGLGTYMQPLYLRWLHGERAFEAELAEQRAQLVNRYPVVSGTPKTEDEVYKGDVGPGLDIYMKGSLIAHSLRMLIGDEAFFTSVRRLVYGRPDPRPGNFQPRHASTPEFLQIVNEESGQDLTWFFRGYLYSAALPDLRSAREGGVLRLTWVTGDGTAFPMPVEIEVDGQVHTVPMTGGEGELRVADGAHVLIDPGSKVLRHLPHIGAQPAEDRHADDVAVEVEP